MIKQASTRAALLTALAVLSLVYCFWFAYVYQGWFTPLENGIAGEVLFYILCFFPTVPAFLASYLSPRFKIISGLSMALVASVVIVSINFAAEASGIAIDFFGPVGNIELLLITTIWNLVPCGLGTAIGYFTSRVSSLSESDPVY